MSITLTCPYCQFSREVPTERIPAGVRWAVCPRCRQRFEVTGLQVDSRPPGEGIPTSNGDPALKETEDGREGAPWEKRSEIGLWQGIYQTFKGVLFSPEALFGRLRFRNGITEPLAFGLLLGSVGSMLGFFWQFLMISGGLLDLEDSIFDQPSVGSIFLVLCVVVPMLVFVGIFVYSGLLHLLLRLVGGGKNGFEASLRVVAYSQSTQICGFIPFVGGWIGGIWQLIVQIIGLREIHQTSYLRVILAFLLPVALIVFLLVAVLIPLLVYVLRNPLGHLIS